MSAAKATQMLAEAQAVRSKDPKRAEDLYRRILETSAQAQGSQSERESNLRDQESALIRLGELYRDNKDANGLAQVIVLSRSFMSSTAKAKTAKLIRTLLDFFAPIPDSNTTLMDVLHENIEWARTEKRIFLKHSLETRLVGIQLETHSYKAALALIETLLTELKLLDDKLVLTEVHLLESRVYWATGNMPKSKAALTSARTAANSIYCPPHLEKTLRDYQDELSSDPMIRTHLAALYDTLSEHNLLRIIEPYSVIEVGTLRNRSVRGIKVETKS